MLALMMRAVPDSGLVLFGADSVYPMVTLFAARAMGKDLTIISAVNSVDPEPILLPESSMAPESGFRGTYVIPMEEAYDLIGRGDIDHLFVSAAQIDRKGALNSSVIGDTAEEGWKRMGGGGGIGMILRTVGRVDAWVRVHEKRVFPERVDFVTGVGNLRSVITPNAVFGNSERGLQVTSLARNSDLNDIRSRTAFSVEFEGDPDNVPRFTPPTHEEMQAIRSVDPNGVRYLTSIGNY